MSMARSQAAASALSPAQGAKKRLADEQFPRDAGKMQVKEEPRRDPGKRPIDSSTAERARRMSVEPLSGPLEPWVDRELMLKSYHEATKRVLKMEIVEGMFTEEMG
ncbi:hypothetical protein GBA52_020729 [Prunus armeniaca]|nr:hypothetical protein GBA52_020729 [Prunus armeniaca]